MTPRLIRGGHRRDGKSPCPEPCTTPWQGLHSSWLLRKLYWEVMLVANSDEQEYSTILIKLPLNIICICICTITPLQKYSDICLHILWQMNIFRYSLIKPWKSEYIWIFLWNLILIFVCLWLMNNVNQGPNYVSHKIHCTIYSWDSMSESFFKVTAISYEYEYTNIQIKWPSNIIRICICAISRVRIYLYTCLANMWHPNILGYLFGKLFGIQIYLDIRLGPYHDIRSSLVTNPTPFLGLFGPYKAQKCKMPGA